MKREGRKIVGVVAWDTPMAQLAERAGVDLISVGDSVGKNLWGHATENEVTVDELLVVCKAVRRGAKRALVSCDVPAAAGDSLAAAQRLGRRAARRWSRCWRRRKLCARSRVPGLRCSRSSTAAALSRIW